MLSTLTRTAFRAAYGGARKRCMSTGGGRVFETTAETFDRDVLKAQVPTVVDFYANWCQPCKMLSPILAKAVEKDGRVNLAMLNVDEHVELARDYQITSLPTVIAFRDGKPVNSFMGLRPPNLIEQFVKDTVDE
ncbi:hypothetical protein FB645_003624 [Coemansia sp. IMI 203386]|nr:hypothetical protein FB645_003624 [Coemansia sp. IMI 203386]